MMNMMTDNRTRTVILLLALTFTQFACTHTVELRDHDVLPDRVRQDSQHDSQHTTGLPCISLTVDTSASGCLYRDEGVLFKVGYMHDFERGSICDNHYECAIRGRVRFDINGFIAKNFELGEKIVYARLFWSSKNSVNLPDAHPHAKDSCLSKLYVITNPLSSHPVEPEGGNKLMYPLSRFTEEWESISDAPYADITSSITESPLPPIELVITGHDESIGNKDNYRCVSDVSEIFIRLTTATPVYKWPGSQ